MLARLCMQVITLDTAGANYRSVWAMHKHFPHVKTFVRAFDIENGVMLEKAGATAVVPEILEPSLQLAAAVLSQVRCWSSGTTLQHASFVCVHSAVCPGHVAARLPASCHLTPHLLYARAAAEHARRRGGRNHPQLPQGPHP